MYLRTDVTCYIHVLAQHVPQFMRYLKQKGMVLRHFSTSSIEKKNHQQVLLFFGGPTMGRGKSKKPVIHDILYYENRQLIYQTHNTPIKYTRKTMDIKT
ncbi:unnamed protein product [Rhizophagus irregularis]|nr:unnamed protein product [Rhizophagus irregularis]